MLQECGVLTLFTPKYASRHNGVQFFNFHLASWLRTRRFSEPTFRPSGATKQWKNHSVSRLSYLFAHLHLLSSDFLPLWSSPSLIFSLLTFSMSELLPGCAFPSVHTVGSLASKLPSIIEWASALVPPTPPFMGGGRVSSDMYLYIYICIYIYIVVCMFCMICVHILVTICFFH